MGHRGKMGQNGAKWGKMVNPVLKGYIEITKVHQMIIK
jgi:hypothetical protein